MTYDVKIYGEDNSIIDPNKIYGIEEIVDIDKNKFLRIILDKINMSNEYKSLFINEVKDDNDCILFRDFNNKLLYGNVVGVIKVRIDNIVKSEITNSLDNDLLSFNVTLQITSRFDYYNISNGNLEIKPYFLITMMMEGNPKVSNNMVPSKDLDFFDFLLFYVYRQKLLDAYAKGFYKTYHLFEKNDEKVKGTIDVSRHIKFNAGLNNGRIAYSYREKSIDNYLNHLIIEAYHHLKNKYYDFVTNNADNDDFNLIINELEHSIGYPKYHKSMIISKNIFPIAHPFYTEYEKLREVCLQILRDEGTSFFDGSMDDISGLLFYLPTLFENYLENYIRGGTGWYMKSQHEESVRVFDYNDNCYKKETYPDYSFFYKEENEEVPFMILDAKFKPDWGKNICNRNTIPYLDDYDKCIRDMNSFFCHATGIIAPTDLNIPENHIIHNVSKYNTLDRFYTFFIKVEKSDAFMDYESWNKEFTKNRNETIKKIDECICNEMDYYKKIKPIICTIPTRT